MTKPRRRLPKSVQQFVGQQTTTPVSDLYDEGVAKEPSPYGSYWYRVVAAMLLCGRVKAKYEGYPNRTEVNRICKEANFNQYLVERVGSFLVAAGVIRSDLREQQYGEGPNAAAFWRHDNDDDLRAIARRAFLLLAEEESATMPEHLIKFRHPDLIDFLTIFFACFRGLALSEPTLGDVFYNFTSLPGEDLVAVGSDLGLDVKPDSGAGWRAWLDAQRKKKKTSFLSALGTVEWVWYAERKGQSRGWIVASSIGLGMLGLGKVPPAPKLPTTLKVGPDLTIHAGTGLPLDHLVKLFRHCVVQRVGEVCEFRLDKRRLAQERAGANPGEELRQVLQDLGRLPEAISSILDTQSALGGVVKLRWCSALLKPENADVLEAIRRHPQLKNYIEPGAPPGYLLVKGQSDINNFIWRCRQLGFQVEAH